MNVRVFIFLKHGCNEFDQDFQKCYSKFENLNAENLILAKITVPCLQELVILSNFSIFWKTACANLFVPFILFVIYGNLCQH